MLKQPLQPEFYCELLNTWNIRLEIHAVIQEAFVVVKNVIFQTY